MSLTTSFDPIGLGADRRVATTVATARFTRPTLATRTGDADQRPYSQKQSFPWAGRRPQRAQFGGSQCAFTKSAFISVAQRTKYGRIIETCKCGLLARRENWVV